MCAYHVGENVILVKAYQTKHDRHRLLAYNRIMKRIKQVGMQVKMQVLDNEVSANCRSVKAKIENYIDLVLRM